MNRNSEGLRDEVGTTLNKKSPQNVVRPIERGSKLAMCHASIAVKGRREIRREPESSTT